MNYEDVQKMVKTFSFIVASGFGVSLFSTLYYMINKMPTVQKHNEFKRIVEENKNKYLKQINEYDEYVVKYCDEIKKLDLSDLELFIKLFNDLWKNIDGYNNTNGVILGFNRLILHDKNEGCCRHFVDDMVAKLNYINPKYNARAITVYMEKILENTYKIPIKRNIINEGNNLLDLIKKRIVDEYGTEYFSEHKDEILEAIKKEDILDMKRIGNHVVCAIDIPHKNITLMLDPTNTIIGYFKGKKIITFGGNKTGYKYLTKENYIANDMKTFLRHELESDLNKLISFDTLNKLYGKEAQQRAYENVLYIDEANELGYQKSL